MFDDFEDVRDLSVLEVRAVGSLAATGSKWEPYRLLGPADQPVGAVASFFGDLLAAGCSEATVRSYGMDLLRWFRFLWRSRWRGTARPGWRPAISADGLRSPTVAGVPVERGRIRFRCGCIAKRCCAAFTISTATSAPARW